MRSDLARIQNFSREMKEIQRDLFETVVVEATGRAPVFDDPDAMTVLSEFKTTVDDFRRILFFYVRNLSMQDGVDQESAMQSYRLKRATELLEVLSRPSVMALSDNEQQMLVESLDRIMALHRVQRAGRTSN